MVAKQVKVSKLSREELLHAPTFSARTFIEDIPRFEIPEKSLPAESAYQLVADELAIEGKPIQNLASFITTWMEPQAEKLILESITKNLIDKDEYPQTRKIEQRCVNMLARLFHASEEKPAIGTSAVGSSEAIMLAALSHKWNWRAQRKKQKKSAEQPNIVMGGDIQVVWEKFARYFDVEPRILPLKKDHYVLDPDEVIAACDENTICVVAVLGTTFTGQLDPIEAINDKLVELKAAKGPDIPLHVDAASGGFVIPFTQPHLRWDFRLEQVKSINVSGHKYGLVYPGVGFALWRDEDAVPEELVFNVNYLGGETPTFNLNFSRPSSFVVAQYYNFLRLGKAGYRRIMDNLMKNANFLADSLETTGKFKLLSDRNSIPVVTASLIGSPGYDVFDLAAKLKQNGWIVPAYAMPPKAEEEKVLRIVVREGFSRDLAASLIEDIKDAVEALESPGKSPDPSVKKQKTKHNIC